MMKLLGFILLAVYSKIRVSFLVDIGLHHNILTLLD